MNLLTYRKIAFQIQMELFFKRLPMSCVSPGADTSDCCHVLLRCLLADSPKHLVMGPPDPK